MTGKNQNPKHPKLAGMDELDIVTNETDVPVPYFAGFRRLDVSWIMQAVISHTQSVDSGAKGKSAKSGSNSKNYWGHCAGMLCQGALDFFAGLLINNELVFPNAFIWDSQIFKASRKVIYIDGNMWQTSVETDQDPPTFPWTLTALAWVAGSYAKGTLVVANGNMVFSSLINANNTVPPATATSNADWAYLYSPDLWTSLSAGHFWTAGSIVAWEGQVYITNADTNNEPPNAPWTPYQVLESGAANPYLMPVAKSTRFGTNSGPGDWYLYWGLPNQVLDVAGEAILNGLGHPPYRNCPVIVGKKILFGTQTVQPPSVQVLAGRAPVQALIVGASAQLDSRWTANPWCVLAELLTHPILGLGLPATWFNAASWQAEADRCAANTKLFYISPMFTSFKKVSEIVADLLGYPDAFIFWSTVATLMAGHWPHGEAAPAFNATNTVNRNNVRKEFSSQSEGWWGTGNSIAVTISDIQAGFKSRPCLASNLFNMAVTRRVLSQKIDRPYITDYSQGLAWATEFAKIAGDQSSSGAIELQSEKATGVTPGSLFLLTDDALQTSEVQRCTKRVISAPPTGITKITHETERGVAPQPYSPTQANPSQATGPSPSTIQNYQVVQLPTSLAGEGSALTVLAGRQDTVTSALEAWFQAADQSAFQLLDTLSSFAVPGTITINGGVQVSGLLTSNSVMGTTYNLPAETVALNLGLVFYSPLGVFLGAGVYGTDFTVDLLHQTVTILNTSTFPNGSTVTAAPMVGVLATSNSVQGTSYSIPTNWWTPAAVYRMTAGGVAGYAGGLGGATICAEGTDYLIDPATGTFTIVSGGNIANGDYVFVQVTTFMVGQFVLNTPSVDIDAISASLTQDQINDDEILLFAFKAANPSLFEIMSVTAISPLAIFPAPANPWYSIGLKRQQFGTLKGGDGITDFGANDLFFIIPRSALKPLANEAFPGLEETLGTAKFILAPQSAWVSASIDDIYDPANNPTGLSTEFSYTFANTFAPTATWIQQQQNSANIASFAGAFVTTDVLRFAFQLNAPPGANVVSASLVGAVGEQQLTLWSNVFAPSTQINAAAQFSFPGPGLWSVSLNVRCDDGSQISAPLTLVGSAVAVQMTVNAPATTNAPTPIIKSSQKVGKYITNLKFGTMATGLTLNYQLQNRGVALNAGAWVVAAENPGGSGNYGPIPNFQSGAKTLYAYSHIAGSTDSVVVSWNL